MNRPRTFGFTITELLVALAVTSIMMVSIVGFHVSNKLRNSSEDLKVEVQQNLRLAMDRLTSAVRNSNYGTPSGSVSSWITWVGGFPSNRLVTAGPPDSIIIAGCGLQSLTTFASNAAVGATSITLVDASGLNTINKKLIFIDDVETAMIKSVSGNTITIDTDPSTTGNQGLAKAYPATTTLCRVDATTYSIDTTNRRLQVQFNQGGSAIPIADGITGMTIAVNNAGTDPEYVFSLSGQSLRKDPTTNAPVQATLLGRATPLK